VEGVEVCLGEAKREIVGKVAAAFWGGGVRLRGGVVGGRSCVADHVDVFFIGIAPSLIGTAGWLRR
jgi:hypothetical protein